MKTLFSNFTHRQNFTDSGDNGQNLGMRTRRGEFRNSEILRPFRLNDPWLISINFQFGISLGRLSWEKEVFGRAKRFWNQAKHIYESLVRRFINSTPRHRLSCQHFVDRTKFVVQFSFFFLLQDTQCQGQRFHYFTFFSHFIPAPWFRLDVDNLRAIKRSIFLQFLISNIQLRWWRSPSLRILLEKRN